MTNLRNVAFFARDALRGSPIARQIEAMERYFVDPMRAMHCREMQLEVLIKHALEHTAYYSKYQGLTHLRDFPVLEKATIQANYSGFISDAFDAKKLVSRNTSGSYATPLTYLMTSQQVLQKQAELIAFNRWAGYVIGMRIMYLNHAKKPSWTEDFAQNRLLFNPSKLSGDWIEVSANRLLRGDVKFLVGMPSVMEELCFHGEKYGLDLTRAGLVGCITVSESLTDTVRVKLGKFLGCPVLGRYAADEQGVIAQQCVFGNYHVNPLRHIVELLEIDGEKPVPIGTVGRVIITNTTGLAMPLIRYDIGDLAVETERCRCDRKGQIFREIVGRQTEIITDTHGQKILPVAVSTALRSIPGILQLQVTQESQFLYDVKLRARDDFSAESAVTVNLLDLLGQDATLKISYCEHMPRLPSGKRPFVVNEYQRGMR